MSDEQDFEYGDDLRWQGTTIAVVCIVCLASILLTFMNNAHIEQLEKTHGEYEVRLEQIKSDDKQKENIPQPIPFDCYDGTGIQRGWLYPDGHSLGCTKSDQRCVGTNTGGYVCW